MAKDPIPSSITSTKAVREIVDANPLSIPEKFSAEKVDKIGSIEPGHLLIPNNPPVIRQQPITSEDSLVSIFISKCRFVLIKLF